MPETASAPSPNPPPGTDGWRRRLPDLTGAGVRLREPRLPDAVRLARAFGPDEAAAVGVEPPGSSEQWIEFLLEARTHRGAGHDACFVVERDGTREACGLVLLQRLGAGSRVTTASCLFPASEWPTSLPARALEHALGFAFRTVGVGRVEGRAASDRLLEVVRQLGAVEEGVLRGALPVAGGFADQVLWSVLATEWQGRGECGPAEPEGADVGAPGLSGAEQNAERPRAWTRLLPTLKGRLVTLREVELLDASVLLNAIDSSDLDISIEPAPKTRDDMRRYIAWVQLQRSLGRAAGFAIVPRGSRHAAGLIQVRRVDPSGAIAEWGIVIAARCRGTGAAAEATRLMAGFAFDTLGVHRLESRASGIDPRSGGLMRKMGAVREAHLRQSFARGSDVLDDDLWAILEPDWRGGA